MKLNICLYREYSSFPRRGSATRISLLRQVGCKSAHILYSNYLLFTNAADFSESLLDPTLLFLKKQYLVYFCISLYFYDSFWTRDSETASRSFIAQKSLKLYLDAVLDKII